MQRKFRAVARRSYLELGVPRVGREVLGLYSTRKEAEGACTEFVKSEGDRFRADNDDWRRREGIDDVELWEAICGLEIGDFVRLTFLSRTRPFAGETLLVRITSIKGDGFRGKLAQRPALTSLSNLRAGSPVAFTKAHIHSVPKEQSPHEQ
jgi:hypothetical protein